MKRKVIKQGNGTLTVTLPKKWTKKIGLKGGDEIDVDIEGNSVRIELLSENKFNQKSVNLEKIEVSAARVLSSFYKQGYDDVRIFFEDNHAVKKIQDEVKNHLMNYEIVDQTPNSLHIKSLSTLNYSDFDTMLRKSFQVGLSLAKSSLDMIKQGKFDDLKDLLVLENANNRFTSYCHRLLVKKGYKDQKKTVFIYLLIWQQEKVVDNYKYMMQYLMKKKKVPPKKILDIHQEVNEFFELYYELFYKYDQKGLKKFNMMRQDLIKRCHACFADKKIDSQLVYHLLEIVGDVFDLTGPLYSLRL